MKQHSPAGPLGSQSARHLNISALLPAQAGWGSVDVRHSCTAGAKGRSITTQTGGQACRCNTCSADGLQLGGSAAFSLSRAASRYEQQ